MSGRPDRADDLPFPPIRGVIFDFHSTLAHGGEPEAWVEAAWTALGREQGPAQALGQGVHRALVDFLDRIWEHARVIDPDSARDTSAEQHRSVFDATVARAPGMDPDLGGALYAAMPGRWRAYDDAVPVLHGLRERGIRVAVLSNVGFDLRPVLERNGLHELAGALVLSFEVGMVKPDPEIFRRALDAIGVQPEEALMVGDSWQDDGAAAALGIRTLILPRSAGTRHGLDAVLRLVGG
ncbi:MAG: HAD family hydrolase [Actinomycetota bacterium]|nr:HAD family hydrolase [Actinomycetota bacterium]